ncbi:MAG: DUF3108 domain-containing protein [Desulfobulbaceae bacterium]|nr:DUF3108 domain-containing protein [Desulfobulbaceae bacterium]
MLYLIRFVIFLLPLLPVVVVTDLAWSQDGQNQFLKVRRDVLQRVFEGNEKLNYSISWTGGVKIGDLRLEIASSSKKGNEITGRVTDYGLFKLFYPVDDTFITYIDSSLRLPYRYEVVQREGHGSDETKRLSLYDQEQLTVRYQRDEEEPLDFTISGPVHNEFSSFYITRSLTLEEGEVPVVPTFADKKRHNVEVNVLGKEEIRTMFGLVKTIRIQPKMTFRGLYDKDGDTVIWLTDDECRVPVRINSKILIGSLTADLKSYHNDLCPQYHEERRP